MIDRNRYCVFLKLHTHTPYAGWNSSVLWKTPEENHVIVRIVKAHVGCTPGHFCRPFDDSGTQSQHLGRLVLAARVGLDATGHGDDDQHHHKERTHQSLLGQGTEILRVGVAAIAGVGADDGLFLRHLVRGIDELVSTRTPTKHRPLVEQSKGRLPAVDALEVGGVGRDVGDALDVLHKVARCVLVVLLQHVDNLVLEGKEQADQNYNSGSNPMELDAQQHANQDGQQQADEREKVRERLAKSISDRMPEMNGIDLEGCSEPVLQYVAKAADLGGKQIFCE